MYPPYILQSSIAARGDSSQENYESNFDYLGVG